MLANNILNDPTADIMRIYNEKHGLKVKEMKENEDNKEQSESGQAKEGNAKNKSEEVQALGRRKVDTNREDTQMEFNEDAYVLSQKVTDIAQILAMNTNEESEDESESSQSSTHSQLLKKQARDLFKAEADPDYDSLPDAEEKNEKAVHNIGKRDEISVCSSITDVTNNTENARYQHETMDSTASATTDNSSFSIESLQSEEFSKHITEDMTTQEVEQTVEGIMKNHRVHAQRKANKYLSKHLRSKRESQYENNVKVDENMSPVKGNHKSD